MVATLWEIAYELDVKRVPATVTDAVWLEIPTERLRGPASRDDNVNLRKWLERLTGIKLRGEYRGQPWGAVIVGEWHITQHGSMARLLVQPAAIKALRSSETFAKIEITAAHQLPSNARRLYALLADKKRLGKPEWAFDLAELRESLGISNKKTYDRWADMSRKVLEPAIASINDYGTVSVTMTPVKRGRAVVAVKFAWAWKSLDDAHVTAEENERHSTARRKEAPETPDAPPLVEAQPAPVVQSEEEHAEIVAGLKSLTAGIVNNKLRAED